MPLPLTTAVRVAVSINRITSAVGATVFVLAGIYQLFQQMKRHKAQRQWPGSAR